MRRFFVTSQGRFGLGPASLRAEDVVCVLLGSDVPVVLQPGIRNQYFFRGQVYVDGLMDYEGNIQEDIANRKICLSDFTIQ